MIGTLWVKGWNGFLIVFLILVAGSFGGGINSFLFRRKSGAIEVSGDPDADYIGRCIAFGIAASSMVPLFLRTIDSALLGRVCDLSTSQEKLADLLVFFGLCLIAAVYSKSFMQSISDRILKEAKEARQQAGEATNQVNRMKAVVEPIISSETEPETDPTTGSDRSPDDSSRSPQVGAQILNSVGENQLKVLRAFMKQKYALRTRTGIATDAGIQKSDVIDALPSLIEKGLVGKLTTPENKTRYFITQAGRRLIANEPDERASPTKLE